MSARHQEKNKIYNPANFIKQTGSQSNTKLPKLISSNREPHRAHRYTKSTGVKSRPNLQLKKNIRNFSAKKLNFKEMMRSYKNKDRKPITKLSLDYSNRGQTPKYMDYFKLRASVQESHREAVTDSKINFEQDRDRMKLRSFTENSGMGSKTYRVTQESTFPRYQTGTTNNFSKNGKKVHQSLSARFRKNSALKKPKFQIGKSSRHKRIMSFTIPDIFDPGFAQETPKMANLTSQLRSNPRMPKVKGELLNVKVHIDTQSKSSKKKQQLMSTEVLLSKNAKKPKNMKKHEWEVHKKRKVQQYKKMKQIHRNGESEYIQDARHRLYKLFEPLEEKQKRDKKNELESRMKEIYGIKSQELEEDTNFSDLLQQKAILDLIRHGATIEINSQLIKGYMSLLPGRESKDIDTQFIKEVDLSQYKSWDMERRKFTHED